MKKIAALILAFSLPTISGAFSFPETRAKNESSIRYQKNELYARRSGYSMILDAACEGTLPKDLPRNTGLSQYKLENGLACAVGDFDNNGFLDFGLLNLQGTSISMVVLFFSGANVIRTDFINDLDLGIEKSRRGGVSCYPMGFQGEAGEPLAPSDGLFLWRKGKKLDKFTIWFYNSKTQHMEKHTYPYQGD